MSSRSLLQAGSLAIPPEAALRGVSGRSYRTVAAPIRNVGAPDYWQPIVDAAHRPYGIASMTTTTGLIQVDFDFTASKICSFVAVPDETLSNYGYSMGASVTTTQALITMRRNSYSDFISYNGSAWVSATGKTTNFNYASGILTMTHPEVSGYGAATGRGASSSPSWRA